MAQSQFWMSGNRRERKGGVSLLIIKERKESNVHYKNSYVDQNTAALYLLPGNGLCLELTLK